ncbi:MAG: hypothetical protein RIQ94_306, partial [Pseudomonadota bacterium]
MAYLNTQLSKQNLGFVVDNATSETELPVVSMSDSTDYVENSNF